MYHGHTMTSKITFQDVIRTLKEHAFTVNPYPLILSFEMHCSVGAQKRCMEILKEEIGNMIFSIPNDYDRHAYYPSPKTLMYKFIIKCKGKLVFSENIDCEEFDDHQKKIENFEKLSENLIRSPNLIQSSMSQRERLDRRNSAEQVTRQLGTHFNPDGRRNSNFFCKADNCKGDNMCHDCSFEKTAKPKVASINIIENVGASPKKVTDSLKSVDSQAFFYQKSATQKAGSPTGKVESPGEKAGSPSSKAESPISKGSPVIHESKTAVIPSNAQHSGLERALTKKKTKKKKEKHPVYEDLNVLYGMIGRKLDLSNLGSVWEICSLVEEKVDTLFKTRLKELVEYHKKYFTRTYPSNLRVSSSNYNPIPAWGMGAQVVALNFQYHDEPMLLNYAKFQRNGGNKCGYVLKPSFMLHDVPVSDYADKLQKLKTPVKTVTIQVISAQALRAYDPTIKKQINPFVEVKLRGLDFDEKHNIVQKTQTINNNAFHPIWAINENSNKFTFKVAVPEFVTFAFSVYCEDSFKKHRLGWYAVEMKNMRPGYRVVPLLDNELRRIKNSYIFCHISVNNA